LLRNGGFPPFSVIFGFGGWAVGWIGSRSRLVSDWTKRFLGWDHFPADLGDLETEAFFTLREAELARSADIVVMPTGSPSRSRSVTCG
jgi:hypothetical protein